MIEVYLADCQYLKQSVRNIAPVSYWKKKVLILPLLDALSPITGGVGGGLTLRTTSNKKLLVILQYIHPRSSEY